MERISYWLQIIVDCMLNNNLSIDKATFFTVIIGQITIYGILLTFYQFVASYQGGEKAAIRYLGINITEYFVKKKIKIFNKIISKKMFGVLLILEILYKPFMTIYGDTLGASTISIINFVWFSFAIGYFILFVVLFIQCTKSILMIKMSSDVKRNGYIISEINKEFLKKTMKERISKNAIDLLRRDFVNLHDAIQEDENTELQGRYNQLIHLIFTDYIGRKQYEISNIKKKGRILRNQVSWIYNSNCEVHLLQEIIDEMYFQLDEQNIRSILNFHIDLIRLNLIRAELAGYSKVRFNRYDHLGMMVEGRIFDVSEWKDVTLKIYPKLSNEKKQELIRFLQRDINQEQDFYEQYCKECITDMIRVEIDCIFSGKREQKDFVKIFGQIIKDKHFNDFCSQIIRDKIIYYNRFDAGEIIGQLSEKNCTYLFSYIVLYYSIYRFRFEWEYININVLRTLWNHHGSMQDDAEEVIEKIKNSNIGHRFEKGMYFKFVVELYEYGLKSVSFLTLFVETNMRLRRFKIMDISKKDWKLFREKLSGWQEKYMEGLVKEYVNFLNDDTSPASEKFWELEKRIKEDKHHPGVIMELKKSEVIWDIVRLIRLKVITYDDLSEFSEELQQEVKRIIEMSR